jgi:hypothetical protein
MNMMAVPVRGVPHVVAFCFDLAEQNRAALAFRPREETLSRRGGVAD